MFYDSNNANNAIKKYENEPIYKELNGQTNGAVLLKKLINAFENFNKFLDDDSVEIDHTYLWDIITNKNPLLFKEGVNLIILEVPDDDITGNIQIICPTNHYSKVLFDETKKSLILFKSGYYYE